MSLGQRIAIGACVVLVGAGVAGVLTHKSGHAKAAPTTLRAAPLPTAPVLTEPTIAAGPTTLPLPPTKAPQSSAQLAADVVTPTDMGGPRWYTPASALAAQILASSPCLAPLAPAAGQAGRATMGLTGPDPHGVPAVVEVVDSYAGAAVSAAYKAVTGALGACPSLAVNFTGTPATVPVTPSNLPGVGQANQVWSGTFTSAGGQFHLDIGVVLQGTDVLALFWVESVPPSPAIMGNFASTLSLAIGKLA